MLQILLIMPSEALSLAAATASKKFTVATGQEIRTIEAKTGRQAGQLAAEGAYDFVFMDATLEIPDLNVAIGGLNQRLRNGKLVIGASPSNQANLAARVPARQVRAAPPVFSTKFIYECLLEAVNSPAAQPVDSRVMKSIIVGALRVINRHTNEALVPGKVSEDASKKLLAEVSAVTTFYGEGIAGAIIISAPRELLYALAKRLFPDGNRTLGEPLYQDFCCEILNQVLGVARVNLATHGYELFPGVNLAASGAEHRLHHRIPGKYFRFPFIYQAQQFAITLYYAYRNAASFEVSQAPPPRSRSLLDVRLVNEMRDIAIATLRRVCKLPVDGGAMVAYVGNAPRTNTLALLNGAGRQGSFIAAIDVSRESRDAVGALFGNVGAAEKQEFVTRMFAKSLQEIGAQFRQQVQAYGYFFDEVYQCDFMAEGAVTYAIKCSGLFATLPLQVGGLPITLLFGVDSRFANAVFDAYPALEA